MCNLNAFQRLEKDATELVAKKITEQTKLLISVSKKYDTDFRIDHLTYDFNEWLQEQFKKLSSIKSV